MNLKPAKTATKIKKKKKKIQGYRTTINKINHQSFFLLALIALNAI